MGVEGSQGKRSQWKKNIPGGGSISERPGVRGHLRAEDRWEAGLLPVTERTGGERVGITDPDHGKLKFLLESFWTFPKGKLPS